MDSKYKEMTEHSSCVNKNKLLNILPQIELMNEITNSRYRDKLRKEIEICNSQKKIKLKNKFM